MLCRCSRWGEGGRKTHQLHLTSFKEKKKKGFLGNPPAALCFDPVGQDGVAWLPLGAREAGKSGSEFSRWAERWAHCPSNAAGGSAKRKKGACLPPPSVSVPRSELPCAPVVLCVCPGRYLPGHVCHNHLPSTLLASNFEDHPHAPKGVIAEERK